MYYGTNHRMTTPQLLTLNGALGLGIPLLVGAILFVVFRTMFESLKDAKTEYESEGIELDSKPQWVTVRLNNYASPAAPKGISAYSKNPNVLLLTRKNLLLVRNHNNGWTTRMGFKFIRIDRTNLQRLKVTSINNTLHIHCDSPPNASGQFTISLPVDNAEQWVQQLINAGAQRENGVTP